MMNNLKNLPGRLMQMVLALDPLQMHLIMALLSLIFGAVMKYDYCGAAGTQSMMRALEQANDNPSISAIILQIDSPGGAVDGTQQFADAIKNSKKPVVAYINGTMCSAAMWLG